MSTINLVKILRRLIQLLKTYFRGVCRWYADHINSRLLYSTGIVIFIFLLWIVIHGIINKFPFVEFIFAATFYLLMLIWFIFRYPRLRAFTGYFLLPFLLTWATYSNFNDKSMDFVILRFPRIFWISMTCLIIDFCFKYLLGTIHRGTKWVSGIISTLFQTFAVSLTVIILLRNIIDCSLVIPAEIEAICQTDFMEAVYFISSSLACILSLVFFFVFLILKLYWNLSAQPTGIPSESWKKRAMAIALCLLISTAMGWSMVGSTNKLLLYRLSLKSRRYLNELRRFNAIAIQRKNSPLSSKLKKKIHYINKPVRVVLILGESQNKNRMSAYGYCKKTTPWFDSIYNSDRFHIFENAYSCHTITILVLKLLFTNLNQYEDRNFSFSRAITLFDILRHAGFRTFWFSNQHKLGKYCSPTAALSSSTDKSIYITSRLSDINSDSAGYDSALLPFTDKLPRHKKSFSVFHLQGCHYPYRMRYPEGYLKENNWTEYERTMSFNDHVIGQLVQRLQKKGVDVIVFLSDHSEIPEENLYHQPSKFQKPMAEIPMFIYVSQKYEKSNPKIIRRIIRAKKRFFTNDLTFNLLLSLMHIRQKFNSPQLNVLNDTYRINAINAKTLYGSRNIFQSTNRNRM